jgi:CubicO group peptidase (beta-lactamase class C family)
MRVSGRSRFLAIILLLVRAAHGVCESPTDAELEKLLKKGFARGYPGIAMLVQQKNGRTRSAAAGYSNLAIRTPLRVEDAFHLASITKTFTAVAVLRLVDAGRLSLSDTLLKLLGKAARDIPYSDRITVAQLLDHSSGIYATNNDVAYLNTLIGPAADPERIWTSEELVALAGKDRSKPSGLPGKGHFYSDTNYILLGMIVARASGQAFKDHIRETLLTPLELRSTYFYSDYLRETRGPSVQTVRGYLLATDKLRSIIEINRMFKPVEGESRKEGLLLDTTRAAERIDAAGGLVATLPDLLKLASALFRGRLLSAASQRFLVAAGDGMKDQPAGTERIRILQAVRKPYGVLLYKEGDGPGGVNTLMAYSPASDEIFLGFTNIFGYFDEVEFMMDEVIARVIAR